MNGHVRSTSVLTYTREVQVYLECWSVVLAEKEVVFMCSTVMSLKEVPPTMQSDLNGNVILHVPANSSSLQISEDIRVHRKPSR